MRLQGFEVAYHFLSFNLERLISGRQCLSASVWHFPSLFSGDVGPEQVDSSGLSCVKVK